MSTKYDIIIHIWEISMQINDIVYRIITKFNIIPTEYVRKPRGHHPGWTNEYFIELILKHSTGPNIIKAEGCGEQTFNRAAAKLLHPLVGKIHGGNETYKNILMFHVKVKHCPTCDRFLDYAYYGIDNSSGYGIANYCKECMSIRNKAYYDTNKDRYHKPYIEEHRSEYNARNADRRARKIASTPSWAKLEIIKLVYEHCPDGCHVDHKVPLQGDTVCGLHVENNLQYLTIEENLAKSNKLLDEFRDSNLT